MFDWAGVDVFFQVWEIGVYIEWDSRLRLDFLCLLVHRFDIRKN
jgi:hypothetical protein